MDMRFADSCRSCRFGPTVEQTGQSLQLQEMRASRTGRAVLWGAIECPGRRLDGSCGAQVRPPELLPGEESPSAADLQRPVQADDIEWCISMTSALLAQHLRQSRP